jgi:hypothetical protein
MSEVCGVGEILDPGKVKSHLLSVHKYNLRKDLSKHVNVIRGGFALGKEGGLLLCSWPKGGRPTVPARFCDEVWTGIEYQVASHLIMLGCVEEGLEIVRVCRARYDGSVRNPFDECECGHWYGRSLSSYALLQALSGVRYDAVSKTLFVRPSARGDFSVFLSTAAGYGVAGVRGGKPFFEAAGGFVDVKKTVLLRPGE